MAIDGHLAALRERLLRPVDVAGLALFRIGFGALMLVAVLRFFAHGWIAEYFLQPTHFFSYWGFAWVKPWPGPFMYVHFACMGLCALGIVLGYRYRASVVGFGALFAYAHLIDKTNYLNHYYLVMCLCVLLSCLPLHAHWSLDARRPSAPAALLHPVRSRVRHAQRRPPLRCLRVPRAPHERGPDAAGARPVPGRTHAQRLRTRGPGARCARGRW